MPQSYSLKDLPLPIKWLFRPWFLVALALHAVLLAMPLPESDQPVSTETPDESVDGVRLVTLPPNPPPSPASPAAVAPPKATPSAIAPPQVRPSRVTPPRVASPTAPVVPPQNRPTAPPPPKPAATTPSPAVTPSSTPTSTPTPEASITPPPPSPEVVIQPTPDPLAAIPEAANFPHLSGSEPSCGGQAGCWRNTNPQWRSVATTFAQDLQSQGYVVDQLQLGDDTGIRVYEVSKEGEIAYYLNLLSTFEGTVYILSKEPMTREELNQMAEIQS